MTFAVKTKTGKIDQKKTAKLRTKLQKACQKINDAVVKEITEFQELAQKLGVDEESFWRSTCHQAMLTLHKEGMEVYLSAEFGDLFGSPDLLEPQLRNSWMDIEKLQAAKEKWELKQAKRKTK